MQLLQQQAPSSVAMKPRKNAEEVTCADVQSHGEQLQMRHQAMMHVLTVMSTCHIINDSSDSAGLPNPQDCSQRQGSTWNHEKN